jgi:hypothetical protein
MVAAALAVSQPSFVFRSSFKASGLLSRLPDAPALFPKRDHAAGFWRFRVEPSVRVSESVSLELALEQRLRLFSTATGSLGAGVLPMGAPAPFRIRQLDWRLASGPHAELGAEVDRAVLHVRASRLHLTIGRQAVGWGRGLAFSAVDLFAPFTPLEADREWRRGVDAIRADVAIRDRLSIDGVAAIGADLDHSIIAARLRGYAGNVDVEVLGGKRARDAFGGAAVSAAVGDMEVHGEAAVFDAARTVVKALVGGSYRVPLGNGLLVHGEYHYSGFGSPTPAGIAAQLADPAFQERYLRGDTQILGRHAVAILGAYEHGPRLSATGEWLLNPLDRSGVIIPAVTCTFSDRVSTVWSLYVPYGRGPSGLTLGSELGASPLALFAQLKVYR